MLKMNSRTLCVSRATNTSGYVPYVSDDKSFSVLLPSKWNPSKERELGEPRAHKHEAALQISRRETLMAFQFGAGSLLFPRPSSAAYGDSANVFGKATNTSGYVPYVSDDKSFSVLLPSKWNPSKEREFKGMVLRCVLHVAMKQCSKTQ